MYAVIKVAGQQVRVEKGQKIRVPQPMLELVTFKLTDVFRFQGRRVANWPSNSRGAVVSAKVLG